MSGTAGNETNRHLLTTLGRRIGVLRVRDALRYKAPYLLTIVYLYFHVARPSLANALVVDALALCTIGGIAGFGYFSNDVADRRKDLAAGKPNDASALTAVSLAGVFVVVALLALLPWVVFFPADRLTVTLLAAEFALFLAYVLPPSRLKERGLAGVYTDALYAHALPALIAAHTLFLLAPYEHRLAFAAALLVWQLALGARNIVYHQMADFDQDRETGTRTYVTLVGGSRAVRFVERRLIPVEVAGFAGWLTVVGFTIPALPVALLVHAAARAASNRARGTPVHSAWAAIAAYGDAFCLVWMPVVVISAVCAVDPHMSVIGIAHVVLFRRPIYESIATLWPAPAPTAPISSDDARS